MVCGPDLVHNIESRLLFDQLRPCLRLVKEDGERNLGIEDRMWPACVVFAIASCCSPQSTGSIELVASHRYESMMEMAFNVSGPSVDSSAKFAGLLATLSGPPPPCVLHLIVHLHKVLALSCIHEARYDLVVACYLLPQLK
jgi:hypothetical protein